MEIVHITAECFPAAKAGGLGDVTGALPKYLNHLGQTSYVILPFYQTNWLQSASAKLIFEGKAPFGSSPFSFRVYQLKKPELGFDLFLIDIPGRFDRPGVYIDPWSGHPYWDEKERFYSFQIAALEWLSQKEKKPDIIHCHDHHTGLIPFMMKQCFRFDEFQKTPSVVTIHNGEYQGRHDLGSYSLLPAFNLENIGLLEWDGTLNSLAAGIKSAWKVTTVSKGYMKELLEYCHGLELLLRHEKQKTTGILNGIDTDIWNPATDDYLDKNYSIKNYKSGKSFNKKEICREFGLNPEKPLFSFIGRLVREKGADLLPGLIQRCMDEEVEASFFVLGTGDPALHEIFRNLQNEFLGYFDTRLEYNEKLAHKVYAGSDFILMPSRVEPCGLNQLYSMKYGTIPLVRKTGGLADTVIDLSEKDGYGLVFEDFETEQAFKTVARGVELFHKKGLFDKTRKKIMTLDFSWESAAQNYIELYQSLKPTLTES